MGLVDAKDQGLGDVTLQSDAFRVASETSLDPVAVSVVFPCLNEEATVGHCVRSVHDALEAVDGDYEVVVVDNGSSDQSAVLAQAAGARVVFEPEPGYGNACRAGISAARGDVIVLLDADGTYDIGAIPALIDRVRSGASLVIGSRIRGEMEPGAMPFLHRMGTPVLTSLINRLFRIQLTDVNCGLRAIDAKTAHSLGLAASGMEFASEMVVSAALMGVSMAEIPVGYGRRKGGHPKLNTWRDGRRHLRLVLSSWMGRRRHTARFTGVNAKPAMSTALGSGDSPPSS